MKYADIIIDNKSEKTDQIFTYGCKESDIDIGRKVRVPFGRGDKLRDAYVFAVRDKLSDEVKGLKYIAETDDDICLNEEIIETCRWMKRRYMCKYIDAVKCFTPAGRASKRGKKRNPYSGAEGELQNIKHLTDEQRRVIDAVTASIKEGKSDLFLLNGVTGSGKTEVYMHVIADVLERGKTAIMLVPEISLTKQIIDRFIGRFGAENIAVLHSRLAYGERYDEWIRIKRGEVKIVIGARSAVFAPLENIGAIIMDEEHEGTYKSDMTPKYETCEVAIKRVAQHGAVLLMGSATPSVVSWNRANEGIYKKLELKERYNRVELPDVMLVDMRTELKAGNRSIFSPELLDGMNEVMTDGEQVILFLNRRGYSNFISCRECGEAIRCPECGISLTYHKETERLMCHYCGCTESVPERCPNCGSRYIKYFGIGTEQIEEKIRECFPDKNTDRLDLDTVRRKGSIERIIKNFAGGRTDVLVGTQLVAKGLDFKNVGLVGIISADVTLNIPDFRSPERTFQLITQAAGRAGRGDRKGRVIIQTYSPDNYAVTAAAAQDYDAFYNDEIMLRKFIWYPPFSDLMQIVFSSKDEKAILRGGAMWEKELKRLIPGSEKTVFPLQKAAVPKQKDIYRFSLILKSPRGKRRVYLAAIERVRKEYLSDKKAGYNVGVDVNPYSFM